MKQLATLGLLAVSIALAGPLQADSYTHNDWNRAQEWKGHINDRFGVHLYSITIGDLIWQGQFTYTLADYASQVQKCYYNGAIANGKDNTEAYGTSRRHAMHFIQNHISGLERKKAEQNGWVKVFHKAKWIDPVLDDAKNERNRICKL